MNNYIKALTIIKKFVIIQNHILNEPPHQTHQNLVVRGESQHHNKRYFGMGERLKDYINYKFIFIAKNYNIIILV